MSSSRAKADRTAIEHLVKRSIEGNFAQSEMVEAVSYLLRTLIPDAIHPDHLDVLDLDAVFMNNQDDGLPKFPPILCTDQMQPRMAVERALCPFSTPYRGEWDSALSFEPGFRQGSISTPAHVLAPNYVAATTWASPRSTHATPPPGRRLTNSTGARYILKAKRFTRPSLNTARSSISAENSVYSSSVPSEWTRQGPSNGSLGYQQRSSTSKRPSDGPLDPAIPAKRSISSPSLSASQYSKTDDSDPKLQTAKSSLQSATPPKGSSSSPGAAYLVPEPTVHADDPADERPALEINDPVNEEPVHEADGERQDVVYEEPAHEAHGQAEYQEDEELEADGQADHQEDEEPVHEADGRGHDLVNEEPVYGERRDPVYEEPAHEAQGQAQHQAQLIDHPVVQPAHMSREKCWTTAKVETRRRRAAQHGKSAVSRMINAQPLNRLPLPEEKPDGRLRCPHPGCRRKRRTFKNLQGLRIHVGHKHPETCARCLEQFANPECCVIHRKKHCRGADSKCPDGRCRHPCTRGLLDHLMHHA